MKNVNSKIGIFMRVYRNEPEMHKAIQSVLEQTYTNFKYYILVNDKTMEAVRKYQNQDNRIVMIQGKEGEGFRTYAKYIAKENDYVTTIDADDWYVNTYIEELLQYAETYQLDIAACGNFFTDIRGNIIGVRQQIELKWTRGETGTILGHVYAFFRTIWGKLLKSQVLLLYDDSRLPKLELYGGYGGDTLFMFNLLYDAERIGILDKVLYCYRVSETGGTYELREGRLDSDELLFDFVEKTLGHLGAISEEAEKFLYVVYGEAITDTTRLLLSKPMREIERVHKLLYIYQKKKTVELFRRERGGQLDVPQNGYFAKRLYYIIFEKNMKHKLEKSQVNEWQKLFCILFKQWDGKFSPEEFALLLSKKRMMDALVEENYTLLYTYLLEELKMLKGQKSVVCLKLLKRFAVGTALKFTLYEREYMLEYMELVNCINQGERGKAFQLLVGYFQEADELPYCAEKLAELWVNYAAEMEDVEEFIVAKEVMLEVHLKVGKKEQARQEYEELQQSGVEDTNMRNLYCYLYE